MSRSTVRRRLLTLLVAVGLGLVAVPPPPATAATLAGQGWWSQVSTGGAIPGVVGRPDVAAGQLVVEGAASEALSIAAVRFELDAVESSPVLTLAVADVVGEPVVFACRSAVRWQPAEGGAWESRAAPDCTTSVEGAPTADGTALSFNVGSLVRGRAVDVVLVPGKVPNGPGEVLGASFRLLLESPSLVTVPAPPARPDLPPSAGGGGALAGARPSTAAPATPAGGGSGPFAAAPSAVLGPAAPGPSATAASPTGASAALPVVTALADPPRWLGFLLLAAAAALAAVGGRTAPAGAGSAPRGLGRFAREREGTAPRLV